jgi:hypothetical protein
MTAVVLQTRAQEQQRKLAAAPLKRPGGPTTLAVPTTQELLSSGPALTRQAALLRRVC